MQKVCEAKRAAERKLAAAGIGDAAVTAAYIVSYYAAMGMAAVCVSEELIDTAAIEAAVEKVAAGCPAQYAVHAAYFFGREFFVDGRVLIPRPETEILCGHAIAFINGRKELKVHDVCTGSGCVAVTVAANCGIPVGASDISAEAIEVATMNAARHNADVTFTRGDLLEGVAGGLDVITANPPYVSPDEYAALPGYIREYEPQLALLAEDDGLALYPRLVAQAYERLNDGGLLLTETGETQAERVAELCRSAGFAGALVINDYAGLPRVVRANK